MLIEVTSYGSDIAIKRGFLTVNDEVVCPVDDIDGLIIDICGVTISGCVFRELAERGVSVTICDNKRMPVTHCVPISNNCLSARRIISQATMPRPMKNRLWQSIIKTQITMRAHCSRYLGFEEEARVLIGFVNKVKLRDKRNAEAAAAKYYWSVLDHTRVKQGADDIINCSLNWGYVVVRSLIARYITQHGLSGALAVFHRNMYNHFCLADDFMECYRSVVEYAVFSRRGYFAGRARLDAELKEYLVSILDTDMLHDGRTVKLKTSVDQLICSFVEICDGLSETLSLPMTFMKTES